METRDEYTMKDSDFHRDKGGSIQWKALPDDFASHLNASDARYVESLEAHDNTSHEWDWENNASRMNNNFGLFSLPGY